MMDNHEKTVKWSFSEPVGVPITIARSVTKQRNLQVNGLTRRLLKCQKINQLTN